MCRTLQAAIEPLRDLVPIRPWAGQWLVPKDGLSLKGQIRRRDAGREIGLARNVVGSTAPVSLFSAHPTLLIALPSQL